MSNCVQNNYSSRIRSRSKQPVYTSDKRAKFTQRENKKWIRSVTVLGYIFFVSLPAISLSIYYIYMWDPGYIRKFPTEINVNRSIPVHMTPILSTRTGREIDPILPSSKEVKVEKKMCECEHKSTKTADDQSDSKLRLAEILKEGSKSMESSASHEGKENINRHNIHLVD